MNNIKDKNNYFNLVVKTSFIVFIFVIISKLINYFYKIIIARIFGPETFGLFSLGLMILSIFSAIASLGLIDGVLRYVSFYRGKKQNSKIYLIIKSSLTLVVFTSFFCAVILFFSSDFIAKNILNEPELAYYLKVLSLCIPLSVLSGIYLSIIRAFEKISTFSFLVNVLNNVLKLIFLLILIIFISPKNSLLYSYSLSLFFLLLFSYLIYNSKIKKHLLNNKRKFDKKIILDLVNYSWPLMFTGLLSVIFIWTDSFFIGYYLKSSDVGLYSAAATLVGLFTISQDLFLQLLLPLISKELARKRYDIIKDISKQVYKWIFIINLPLFIIIFVFPNAILNLVFGANYISASNALRFLSIGGILSSFMGLFTGLLNSKGKTKIVLFTFSIFASINIILNYFLIPKYGIDGAAIATSISWFLFLLTSLLQVKKYYGFYPLRRKTIRVFVVTIVPVIMMYWFSLDKVLGILEILVIGTLFCIIYFSLILITKCLDERDLITLKFMKSKALSFLKINKIIND